MNTVLKDFAATLPTCGGKSWIICIAAGEVLQSTALAFDTNRRLRFELCGHHAYMPFEECLDTAPGETVKEIAVLTRVGRPTCFVVQGTTQDESGETVYLLSRAAAQRACREQYLDQLENGSVIPCTVTHIENFGAFCDVGCGISALLPIDCLSVSRIASPADRVTVGQQLLCAIKNRDEQDRIVLTLRELLGTWSENAACFAAGEPWWVLCAVWKITVCSLRLPPTWPGWRSRIRHCTPARR